MLFKPASIENVFFPSLYNILDSFDKIIYCKMKDKML